LAESQDIPNKDIAVARATATLKTEPAWIIIHAPASKEDGLHYTDIYGYILNGLDDRLPHSKFLVSLLRNVADGIEENDGKEDPSTLDQREPADPSEQEPPTP